MKADKLQLDHDTSDMQILHKSMISLLSIIIIVDFDSFCFFLLFKGLLVDLPIMIDSSKKCSC